MQPYQSEIQKFHPLAWLGTQGESLTDYLLSDHLKDEKQGAVLFEKLQSERVLLQSELLRFCNMNGVELNSFQTLITEFHPATWLCLCKKDSTAPGWLNQLIKILKEPKRAQDIFEHTKNFRDFSMQHKLIAIVKNNKITLDYDTLKAAADFYPEYLCGVSDLLDDENSRTDKISIMNQNDIINHLLAFFKGENQSLLKEDNPEKDKSSIYEKK